MAYSGVMDDIQKCISLQRPSRMPVFATSEEFDVRNAGVIYNDYNRNAELMAKVQIEAIKRFDYDWAWLQVDDCIEFEVLGVGVTGSGDILPATCDYLPATYETLRGLKAPDPHKDGRMPVLLEAIKRIKKEMGDTVCVSGRIAAPFSAVTLIFGMTETLLNIYDDPNFINEAIKFCTDMQIKFAVEQIKAGADVIWVGDCNASGHLISSGQYREYALESCKNLINEIHNAGGLTFLHNSEHKLECLEAQTETGASAVSIGPGLDISLAKKHVGHRVCLIGNQDPILSLLEGSEEEVYTEAKRIASAGLSFGGHLFNSGEMIPRDIPEANMRAMIRGAREIGLNLSAGISS